jgi:hypothetical protein
MDATRTMGLRQGRTRPAGAWACAAALALTATAPAPGAAQTQVYRCQVPNGAIEFRQEPCAPGSQGGAITIEDRPTGWTLAPPDQGAGQSDAPSPRKKKASKGRSSGTSARERREQTCDKKHQQVEDINRQLRLGTSARQGTDLRHRRSVLEDFLYEHCD